MFLLQTWGQILTTSRKLEFTVEPVWSGLVPNKVQKHRSRDLEKLPLIKLILLLKVLFFYINNSLYAVGLLRLKRSSLLKDFFLLFFPPVWLNTGFIIGVTSGTELFFVKAIIQTLIPGSPRPSSCLFAKQRQAVITKDFRKHFVHKTQEIKIPDFSISGKVHSVPAAQIAQRWFLLWLIFYFLTIQMFLFLGGGGKMHQLQGVSLCFTEHWDVHRPCFR